MAARLLGYIYFRTNSFMFPISCSFMLLSLPSFSHLFNIFQLLYDLLEYKRYAAGVGRWKLDMLVVCGRKTCQRFERYFNSFKESLSENQHCQKKTIRTDEILKEDYQGK